QHALKGAGISNYLPIATVIAKIFATVLEHQRHQIILFGRSLGHNDVALLMEHPRHRATFAQVTAILGESVPDLADGAIPVIGRHIYEQSYTARSVALEHDLFVGGTRKLPRTALNCALDVVGGHVFGLGCSYGRAEARIALRVAPAGFGGHGNFLDQPGEYFAALGIERALLVFDRGPF